MTEPSKPSNPKTGFGQFANKRFAILLAIVIAFLMVAIWVPF
ncbi:hypothetical protein [Comamonas odontotermitis]